MLLAAHNVGSTGIRIKSNINSNGHILWLPDRLHYKRLNPEIIIKRTHECLKFLPKIADSLVLINSPLVSLDILKTLADISRNYAKKITIISPIIARINFLLNDLTEREIPNGSFVLIITPAMFQVELLILENKNRTIYPVLRKIVKKEDFYNATEYMVDDFKPDFVIICYHYRYHEFVKPILPQFQYKKYVSFDNLFYNNNVGGLCMAESVIGQSYWNIANFSIGIDAYFTAGRTILTRIVPFGALFPFNLRQIHHFTTFKLRYGEEIICRHGFQDFEDNECFYEVEYYPKDTDKMIVQFDENGIPIPGEIPELFSFNNVNVNENVQKVDNSSELTMNNDLDSTPEDPFLEKIEELNINDDEYRKNDKFTNPTIIIKKDNLCGIQVKKGNQRIMLKANDSDEWIPAYISLKTGKPIIGDEAKLDYKTHREYVIFDIFKLIDKKYDEIINNPKWGFKIEKINDSDDFIFIVKHDKSERKITTETALALILQAMKLIVHNLLDDETLDDVDIEVKTDYQLNNKEKNIFIQICEKIGLTFVQ